MRDVHGEGGRGCTGTLYFLLNFAMSLKLLFKKKSIIKEKRERKARQRGRHALSTKIPESTARDRQAGLLGADNAAGQGHSL